MKRWKFQKERGFTLIEIIVVLVIMGIMAIGLSNALTYGVKGFVFARDADQLSQKAQLAMARINKELTDMTAVSTSPVPSDIQITYTSSSGDTYVLSKSGTQILLKKNSDAAQILLDGLSATNSPVFLSYVLLAGTTWTTFSNLATIKVQISLDVPGGSSHADFESSISPRANGIISVPLLN